MMVVMVNEVLSNLVIEGVGETYFQEVKAQRALLFIGIAAPSSPYLISGSL